MRAADIVLDLPVAPSVNRSRRVNWAARAAISEWHRAADMAIMAARAFRRHVGPFELHVTLSEQHTGCDLDNTIKALVDYLRQVEIIEGDQPSLWRRLTVEWGDAPHGCRIRVIPIASQETSVAA